MSETKIETDKDRAVNLATQTKDSFWPRDTRYSVEAKLVSDSFSDYYAVVATSNKLAVKLSVSVVDLATPPHTMYLAVLAVEDAFELGVKEGRRIAFSKLTDALGKMCLQ